MVHILIPFTILITPDKSAPYKCDECMGVVWLKDCVQQLCGYYII